MYELLEYFSISKSSNLNRNKNNKDKYKEEKDSIKQLFEESKAGYGYRRISAGLRNQGVVLNHKTVLKFMDEPELHSGRKNVN